MILLQIAAALFTITGIEDLREKYHHALSNSKTAGSLITYLQTKENPTALEMAYLGSTQMVSAKFFFMPWDKLNTFNAGKENLEKAVNLEPKNPEIIYLRYTIQTNTPAFLNYNNNIVTDRLFLEQNLNRITDNELKKINR